jgi:hypothetical protein
MRRRFRPAVLQLAAHLAVYGRLRALVAFALLFAACSLDRIVAENLAGEDEAPLFDIETAAHVPRTLRLLKLASPDGSYQTVHPDFAQASRWADPMLLVATPYPGGSPELENPTLYARRKGLQWQPVSEQSNPLAEPTAGHLSDPDLVSIPGAGELWIYYRQTDSRDRVRLTRTHDGVQFGKHVEVLANKPFAIVSPAVVRRDSMRWRMWSVNASDGGCRAYSTSVELRRSLDGLHWGKPTTVSLGRPGSSVWHLDVQWIPSRQEYWALFISKVAGTCNTRALYLATSPDGVTWTTYPQPVISAGVIPEFADVVYRSTFAYNPTTDAVRLWYSGARAREDGSLVWQSAFDRRNRAELFEAVSTKRPVPHRLVPKLLVDFELP